LTGIAPVAPIQKSEDRKSDLHIYASDKTIVQFINGNDNVTSGSDNRTAQGIAGGKRSATSGLRFMLTR
jgi:hypothetical protein